jgi:hypothetical protein
MCSRAREIRAGPVRRAAAAAAERTAGTRARGGGAHPNNCSRPHPILRGVARACALGVARYVARYVAGHRPPSRGHGAASGTSRALRQGSRHYHMAMACTDARRCPKPN